MEVNAAIQRLEGGVRKLAQSAEAVAHLEENLKVCGLRRVREKGVAGKRVNMRDLASASVDVPNVDSGATNAVCCHRRRSRSFSVVPYTAAYDIARADVGGQLMLASAEEKRAQADKIAEQV